MAGPSQLGSKPSAGGSHLPTGCSKQNYALFLWDNRSSDTWRCANSYETIFAGGWTSQKNTQLGGVPSYARGFTTHLTTLF